jgi:predicted CopG family antitoxin
MRKHVVVPLEVYEKLNQLKQELGKLTIAEVVTELIKVYEGLKAVKTLQLLLQSLEDAKKVLATFNQALSTASQLQRSYEKEQKGAQKGELASYMRR